VGFAFSPFVIFLILEGGRGGINYYFLIFKSTFEKGRGCGFIYLLLFFANFLLFIFFCHIFYLLSGEGGMGFIFLPFCYFL